MPLPVIPKYPKWKSCNSLPSSLASLASQSSQSSQSNSRRAMSASIWINGNQFKSLSHSNSSATASTLGNDALQSEIAAWQESVSHNQVSALVGMLHLRNHHHKVSRNLEEAHHRRLMNGHTVIKKNNHFNGTSCKITVNSHLLNNNNNNNNKQSTSNGHAWQGLQNFDSQVKAPFKSAN